MAEKKKLGDILKEAGLIDDFQLQSALSHQRNWGGRLGAILVDMGFVREEDLGRVIAETLRIPQVNLFEPAVPEAVIKLIKPDIAKKYSVMPAKKEGGALMVAMADPLDIHVIDELQFITGLNIKPVLASATEIKDAIRKYYDHEEVIRSKQPITFGKAKSPEKMEIIHGSDLTSGMEKDATAEDPVRQETAAEKLRLDALISLLIEKDLISRDELVKMIYQKKMGL